MTQEHIISIHSSGQEILLENGRYKIDLLGGWGVRLGTFAISFVYTESGETIHCKRAFWPVQFFAFKRKAKRIFVVDVPQTGAYKIEFTNPKSLQVKDTNLFFTSFLKDPIPNEKLSVFIHASFFN
jgi:hypothetical protein